MADEKKGREEWENRYREGTVERALLDAAVSGDAYDTDTVMAVLRPMTRLTEITDEKTGKGTGKIQGRGGFPGHRSQHRGADRDLAYARKRGEADEGVAAKYGNLFKSGVVSGIGSSSATGGLTSGGGGKMDCGS